MADLIRLAVVVIVVKSGAAFAAKAATTTVPISSLPATTRSRAASHRRTGQACFVVRDHKGKAQISVADPCCSAHQPARY
jgi:hypothetical protein